MIMRLVDINKYKTNKTLLKLIKEHLDETKVHPHGYVFLDGNRIKGYTLLQELKGNQIHIDWIWAKHGHGTDFLKRLETALFKKYKKIILKVSIDPTEKKDTVKRRINFYIKNNYRVEDVKYKKDLGPLLTMYKKKY